MAANMKKGFKVNKASGIVDIVYASLVMFVGIIMLFYLIIVGSLVSGSVGAAGGSQDEVGAAFGMVGVIVLTIFCALLKQLLLTNLNKQQKPRKKKTDDNMFDSLDKLNKLRLDEAITQEEFEQMKKKIIE